MAKRMPNGYPLLMRHSPYWSDLTTRDFDTLNMSEVIAVLPIAAVEQHGPHLPVGVDAMIMDGCIDRVAKRLPGDLSALFLPIQSVGVSTEHRDFAGTLTISTETAARVLLEIAAGPIRAGCRKLVLLNSHGGNSPLISQTALELRAREGVLAATVSWSRFGYPDGLFREEELRHGIHGGEIETSLMLAFRPDLVDMSRAKDFAVRSRDFERDFAWLRADRPAGFGWMAQDLSPEGAMGDAESADAAKGEATADYWATAFIELLRDVEAFDLEGLAPPGA
jgi:creatinine amidohydrolase